MPRLISFALTIPQFIDQSKTVTRRTGWLNLQAGDLLCGVEKSMGLKKGEKAKRLGMIRVLSARREPINSITADDVVREGFTDMTPSEFVEFYCKANKCKPDSMCTRIEFEYVNGETT